MTTKIPVELSSTPSIVDNGDATAITITSDENVGIKTTSPIYDLQIGTYGTDADSTLAIATATDGSGNIRFGDGTSGVNANQGRIMYDHSVSTMQLWTAGEEAIRLTSGGALSKTRTSVGTILGHNIDWNGSNYSNINTSYGSKFIQMASNAVYFRRTASGSGNQAASYDLTIDSNGLIGIGTTAPASNGGANAGLIHLHGGSVDWSVLHCTTPTTGSGASDGALIGVIADDIYVTNYETGGEILFGVNNSIKIKVDSSGNLVPRYDAGYSGHSDLGTSALRYEDAYVRDGVTTGSDRNEKENITESDLGLTFIKELNPVSYTWKNNSSNRTHYGLIAQDIETWLSDNDKTNTDFAALIKEDISEEQDGSNFKYGLRYTEFISPLIKAIQEQQAIIEDLQTQINEVKNGN